MKPLVFNAVSSCCEGVILLTLASIPNRDEYLGLKHLRSVVKHITDTEGNTLYNHRSKQHDKMCNTDTSFWGGSWATHLPIWAKYSIWASHRLQHKLNYGCQLNSMHLIVMDLVTLDKIQDLSTCSVFKKFTIQVPILLLRVSSDPLF